MQDKISNNSTKKAKYSPQAEAFTRKLATLLLKQAQQEIERRKNDQNIVPKKESS